MMTIETVHGPNVVASEAARLSFPDERRISLGLDVEHRLIASEPGEPWYYPSGLSPITELAFELGLVDSE